MRLSPSYPFFCVGRLLQFAATVQLVKQEGNGQNGVVCGQFHMVCPCPHSPGGLCGCGLESSLYYSHPTLLLIFEW